MGVDVTFSTSLSVIRRIDKKTTPRGLTFALFPDGHDNGTHPSVTLQQYISDFATNGGLVVAQIINSAANIGQPFDNVVYTTVVPWATKVVNAHNVNSTLLWCQPATLLDIYYYYFNTYEEFISSNEDYPTFPIDLPRLPPLTIANLPSFLLPTRPKEHDFILHLLKDHVDALKVALRVLVNTFYELEVKPLKAIDKLEFFPIGPLIPLDFLEGNCSSGSSIDKQEDDCIQWLHTQPKSSVVYVSFGSQVNLSMEQVEKIAIGLLESGRPFLWVIRDGEQARRLSKIEELQKQGMIVHWCSQVVVLSHQAIGCFVMHGGWNSTMEAFLAGVPSIVFPQWSDQGTNGKMIQDLWKTGVRVKRREGNGVVEWKEIERCVEMVMGDGEMRRNVEKWKDLARKALKKDGSSSINLQTFLDDA